MCGIFGWNLSKDALNLLGESRLKRLAEILSDTNDARGGDSWGYYAYSTEQDDYTVDRGLGKIQQNIDGLLEYNVVMAHCRNATTGEVIVENSHPFKVGNLLGAHNGCVYNHSELNRKYNREFSVDSQHIFQHINDKIPISDIIGYGSLEWVDVSYKKDIIFLFKQQQSLRVIRIKDSSVNPKVLGVVWSSIMAPITQFLEEEKISNTDITFRDGILHYASQEDFFIDEEVKMSFGEDISVRNKYRRENYKTTYGYTSGNDNAIYQQLADDFINKEHIKKDKRHRYLETLIKAARMAVNVGCNTKQKNKPIKDDKKLWVPDELSSTTHTVDDPRTILWYRKEVLTKQIKALEKRIDTIFKNGYDSSIGALVPKQKVRLNLTTKALSRKKASLKNVEENLMAEEKKEREGVIDVSAVW